MSDPIDNISSGEFEEFRDTFRQFLLGQGVKGSGDETSPGHDELKTKLLDLLIKQEDDEFSREFRNELSAIIEKLAELSILEIPNAPSMTTNFLRISLDCKKQIYEKLEKSELTESMKQTWSHQIERFFDTFVYELITRWEEIDSQRHIEEIGNIKAGQVKLQRENERLRGIYALSIETASLNSTDEILKYLAKKLPAILPIDALILFLKSADSYIEIIFPVREISQAEIDMGRQKLEEFFELFQRIVIDPGTIDVRIMDIQKVRISQWQVEPPESIFVPLIERNHAWGILGALRKAGNPFNPQEVQSLSIVANLIDLVVRNRESLEKEREMNKSLDEQIKFARKVQQNVLPIEYKSDSINIRTRLKPSESISGDLYQFFKTSHNEQGVLIGDVTGHDVAAGLMMMTVMGILAEVFSIQDAAITEMLERANNNLSRMVSDEFFVTSLTAWVADDNKLHYFNAGHPPGLLCRGKTKEIVELLPDGFPLGIFENLKITPNDVPIFPGDRILLYTDGLIEARDKNGAQYGISKLKDLFSRLMDYKPESVLEKILESVRDHVGQNELKDDVALVLVDIVNNTS